MPAVIFCPAGLEPEKMLATTVYGARVYGVRGSYDDCSRLISELAGEVDWGFVNVNLRSYYAEGSKTLAFEIVEQLGWETPTAVVCPIASGALFTKLWQGFEQFGRLGLIGEERPRLYGGQAEGCAPVADRVRRGAARLAGAAELDRPLARDRQPGRRRPRDRDGARLGWRDLRRARGRGRPEHGAARRDVRHLRRDRRRGDGRRAPRGGRRAGEIGEPTASSSLVTGTGLKTPQAVEHETSGTLVEIEPDLDALLDGARGDGVTDAVVARGARSGDHARSTASCSPPSTAGSSSCARLHDHKLAQRACRCATPAARRRCSRASRRRTPGRSRPTGSPSFFRTCST